MRPFLLFLLILSASVSAAGSGDVWVDVPFVKQTQNGCGAAVVSMVLQYWERETGDAVNVPDYAEILQELYSESAKGVPAEEMLSYLKSRGFQVFAFSATPLDLQHHLAKGRPLISAFAPDGRDGPLHYVVIAGMDASLGYVLYNDPAERKLLRMKVDQFEELRKPLAQWTLLALPSGGR